MEVPPVSYQIGRKLKKLFVYHVCTRVQELPSPDREHFRVLVLVKSDGRQIIILQT